MTTITLSPMEQIYRNNGQHCEQWLIYTLTGERRHADNKPFDTASDFGTMSIKSARATLVSGAALTAETYDGQVAEYFARVHSTEFAFVSRSGKAYIMDKNEFHGFVLAFGKWAKDSAKNGGRYKIRFTDETRAMREWFAARL